MLEKEALLKDTLHYFAVLEAYARQVSIIGLYDYNIIAQDFAAALLNKVYGWRLVNLDYLHRNQPGIDLGDPLNGIAVQVTAERGRAKIQQSIDMFVEYELYRQYSQLYFFILTQKQSRYKPFSTGEHFSFDVSAHILDFSDLTRSIRLKSVGEIAELAEFLCAQIRDPQKSRSVGVSVLRELLDELPTIEPLHFYDPRFQTWHNRLKQAVRHIFGVSSPEVAEYANIAWHTTDDPAHAVEQQGLYSRSCLAARGLLEAWIANAKRGGVCACALPSREAGANADVTVALPFDILDAEVQEYLPRIDTTSTREEQTPALIVYKLHHKLGLGNVGEIHVLKFDDRAARLRFIEPAHPTVREALIYGARNGPGRLSLAEEDLCQQLGVGMEKPVDLDQLPLDFQVLIVFGDGITGSVSDNVLRLLGRQEWTQVLGDVLARNERSPERALTALPAVLIPTATEDQSILLAVLSAWAKLRESIFAMSEQRKQALERIRQLLLFGLAARRKWVRCGIEPWPWPDWPGTAVELE